MPVSPRHPRRQPNLNGPVGAAAVPKLCNGVVAHIDLGKGL